MASDPLLRHAVEVAKEHALASGMALYPASIDVSGGVPIAPWPGEELETFVAAGAGAGARILYLRSVHVDDDLVSAWVEELGHDEELLAELATCRGDLVFVSAAWVVEGVVHTWFHGEPWWTDWHDRAERRAIEVADELESESVAHDRARIGELAAQVAADPAFRRAGQNHRRARCLEVIEFLVDRPGAVVGEITDAAAAIIDTAAGPRARRMRTEGKSKREIIAALDITESMLERYLADKE